MSILTHEVGGAAVLRKGMTYTVLDTRTRSMVPKPCRATHTEKRQVDDYYRLTGELCT
jgi:hypothetical protein